MYTISTVAVRREQSGRHMDLCTGLGYTHSLTLSRMTELLSRPSAFVRIEGASGGRTDITPINCCTRGREQY